MGSADGVEADSGRGGSYADELRALDVYSADQDPGGMSVAVAVDVGEVRHTLCWCERFFRDASLLLRRLIPGNIEIQGSI